MRFLFLILLTLTLCACSHKTTKVPAHLKHVDQVLWIVDDLDNVMAHWQDLGFRQILVQDTLEAELKSQGTTIPLTMARANLGGAHIVWIQPLEKSSVFAKFHSGYGDGAMSLVHRMANEEQLQRELERLSGLGVNVLEELSLSTGQGNLKYTLMDTRTDGKYVLGYTCVDPFPWQELTAENRHHLKLNQYAFAIRKAEPVSAFWAKIGFPEFEINHPVLGDTKYYGEIVDHELIQGWQRHGTVAYEWCIPVKPPIVYEDHINLHGEGIHHLAFSVSDMDAALQDYAARGYVNTMGGTWGERGKPGSGRYEYIGLEDAGGVTMELLWNYTE